MNHPYQRRPKPSKLAEHAKAAGVSQALLRCLQDGSVKPTPEEQTKIEKLKKKDSHQ